MLQQRVLQLFAILAAFVLVACNSVPPKAKPLAPLKPVLDLRAPWTEVKEDRTDTLWSEIENRMAEARGDSAKWQTFQTLLQDRRYASVYQFLFKRAFLNYSPLDSNTQWRKRWIKAAQECQSQELRKIYAQIPPYYNDHNGRHIFRSSISQSHIHAGDTLQIQANVPALRLQRSRIQLDSSFLPAKVTIVDTVSYPIGKDMNLAKVPTTGMDEGIWRLTLLDSMEFEDFYVNISPLDLVVRQDRQRALIWAASPTDTTHAPFQVHVKTPKGWVHFQQHPDSLLDLKILRDTSLVRSSLQVVVERNGLWAFSTNVVQQDYSQENQPRSGIWFDRPIYRPGQWVHFHGLLRSMDENDQLIMPTARLDSVEVVIVSRESGNTNWVKRIAVDAEGHFGDSMRLDSSASLGWRYLNLKGIGKKEIALDGFEARFEVEEYRRPEFTLRVVSPTQRIGSGDTARIQVQGSYFFGAPTANLPVRVRWKDCRSDSLYREISSSLDENGAATFTMKTPDHFVGWRQICAEVIGTDASRREERGQILLLAWGMEKLTKEEKRRRAALRRSNQIVPARTDTSLAPPQLILDKSQYSYGDTSLVEVKSSQEGLPVLVMSVGTRMGVLCQGVIQNGSFKARIPVQRLGGRFGIEGFASTPTGMQRLGAWVTVADPGPWLRAKVDLPAVAQPGDSVVANIAITDQKGNPHPATFTALLVDASVLALVDSSRRTYGMGALLRPRSQGAPSLSLANFSAYLLEPQSMREPSNGSGMPPRQKSGVRNTWNGDIGGAGGSLRLLTSNLGQTAGMGNQFEGVSVRANFSETGLWLDRVHTNSSGHASLRFKLPDNLTRWKLVLLGADNGSHLVRSESNIEARKWLMVKVEAPRTLVQRDTTLIGTVVHNLSPDSATILVQLELKGDAGGLQGTNTQTVRMGGKSTQALEWPVVALKPGTLGFTVRAIASIGTNTSTDAETRSIPVHSHGTPVRTSETGILHPATPALLPFKFPEDSDPASQKMSLVISPNPVSTVLQSLQYLTGFPYGCVEQTLSRFVPNHFVAEGMRRLGRPDTTLERMLVRYDSVGVNRLKEMQNPNGSWGWWSKEQGDRSLTAQALEGLTTVLPDIKRNNPLLFPTTRFMIEKSANFLFHARNKGDASSPEGAHLYRALSRASRFLPLNEVCFLEAKATSMAANAKSLSTVSLAIWLESASLLKLDGPRDLLRAQLESRVVQKDGFLYWDTDSTSPWWNHSLEVTAQALLALNKSHSTHLQPERVLPWLLQQNSRGYWRSTHTTARVIEAIMANAQPEDLSVPGGVVISFADGSQKEFSLVKSLTIPIPFKSSKGQVQLRLKGQGKAFYTLVQEYASLGENEQAIGTAIKVQRTYSRLVYGKGSQGSGKVERKPFTGILHPGDELEVRLTLNANTSYDYLMLEDPLPRGMEVLEKDFTWTNLWCRNWWLGYSHKELRDDRMVYFQTHGRAGKVEFNYILRAERLGTYHALPARAEMMYKPEVFGASTEQLIRIVEK